MGHAAYPGVLDPVYARAVVLSDGTTKVALISWDLTDTREGFVRRVRREVQSATQIPADHILIKPVSVASLLKLAESVKS